MLPLTGFTAGCGNLLLRNPEVPPPLTVPVRPRSPLAPPEATNVTTVTAEPNVTPWSVDLRALMLAPSNHHACSEWSGLTVTNAPCIPVTINVPPLGAQVPPPSVD